MKTLLLVITLAFAISLQAQFSGYYAHANWQTTRSASSSGSISNRTATTITINGSDAETSASNILTEYTILAQSAGSWQFRWDYVTTDGDGAEYDIAYVIINGVRIDLSEEYGDDVQGGVYTSLSVPAGARIGFGIDAVDNVSGNATLTISAFLAPSYVLPVKFTGISALEAERQVNIQWGTANEINNDRFEVQRLNKNNVFEPIGIVFANPNGSIANSYKFKDASSVPGKNYYRIKQIDHNGAYMYSEVVSVTVENTEHVKMSIYPSPAVNTITVKLTNTQTRSLRLYNLAGQLMGTQQVTGGQDLCSWNITYLQPGMYIIKTDNTISGSFIKK